MNFVDLERIPDLGALYRAQVVRVLGKKKRVAEPTQGYRVRGVRVEVDKLAAYCQATGTRLGSSIPALYPYVLGFPLAIKVMDHADFPFKAMGVVHVSNHVTQHRPLAVDEHYDFEVWAQNLRPHRKGLAIDMHTRVSSAGEVVWEQVSTFLSVGSKFDRSTPESVRLRGQDSGRLLEASAEGEPCGPMRAQLRFDQAGTRAYAQASGDKNPIHVSALGAKAFGFPSTIAHGMYSLARMVAFEEGRAQGALEVKADFHKPVLLPARTALYAATAAAGAESGRMELRQAKNPAKLHVVASVA